jgi:hypothetical protein
MWWQMEVSTSENLNDTQRGEVTSKNTDYIIGNENCLLANVIATTGTTGTSTAGASSTSSSTSSSASGTPDPSPSKGN